MKANGTAVIPRLVRVPEIVDQHENTEIVEAPAENDLDRLAHEANRQHLAALGCVRTAIEHARRSGEALNVAKRILGRGPFGMWLAENFEGSDRTARVYMRIAFHWLEIDANRQTSAVLSIDGALKLIAPQGARRSTRAPAGRRDQLLPEPHAAGRRRDRERARGAARRGAGRSDCRRSKPDRDPDRDELAEEAGALLERLESLADATGSGFGIEDDRLHAVRAAWTAARRELNRRKRDRDQRAAMAQK